MGSEYEKKVAKFAASLQSSGFLQVGVDVPELHSLIRHYFPEQMTVAWMVTLEKNYGDGWQEKLVCLTSDKELALEEEKEHKRDAEMFPDRWRNIRVTELVVRND